MNSKLLLPPAFLSLLALGAWHRPPLPGTESLPSAAALTALARANPPQDPGQFPDHWIDGTSCDLEPEVQVHAYNRDLYILRQSKCKTFEAPFLYLIFGDERALLLDTGSAPSIDMYKVVSAVIRSWLIAEGRDGIRLTVAHTHSHIDHISGDNQFKDKPFVEEVVGLSLNDVKKFWGFQDWPNDVPTLDLGNRVLDVLATPGHQPASVTVYDRNTQLLLTGDIVYPGHLFVFSPNEWFDFVDSQRRLVEFAANHPVEWVVGCHIEMAADGTPYAWGTPAHPDEHPLEFRVTKLLDILLASFSMQGDPDCTIFHGFVIHPVYKCGITWNG